MKYEKEVAEVMKKATVEFNFWMDNVAKNIKKFLETNVIVNEKKIMKVKRLNTNAILPKKHFAGDLGYDIYVDKDYVIHPIQNRDKSDNNSENHIYGFGKMSTGIAIEMPQGWGLEVRSRSSAYSKKGLLVQGEIDNSYRGEINIMVMNFSGQTIKVNKGEAIAQIKPYAIQEFEIIEVNNLTETTRGAGGFGSTDNKNNGEKND